MDIEAAFADVVRWCAEQTQLGDPRALEVVCHLHVSITIGEAAPPWRIREQRRCSSGASAPVAQLRYDMEGEEWTLHHLDPPPRGWCSYEDATAACRIGPLLDAIGAERAGRFQGLGPELVRLLSERAPPRA